MQIHHTQITGQTSLIQNFGINLLEDRTAGTGQLIGIIILMIIVVGTQFLSQWLSQRRQKRNQDKAQEDIPEYRRKHIIKKK